MTLLTKRLILRPLMESDLEAFASYRSDPNVAHYQTWTTPYSIVQAKALLEEMNLKPAGTPRAWFSFAIECQNQPGLIGDCAFQVLAEDRQQARIGFTLSRSNQRLGYATEAISCLLDHLFCVFQLHRITAVCDVENSPSFRLLERIGMRREAHFVENIWFKGGWGSEYLYAMLHREWSQRETRD